MPEEHPSVPDIAQHLLDQLAPAPYGPDTPPLAGSEATEEAVAELEAAHDRARYEQRFREAFRYQFPGREPTAAEIDRAVAMGEARDVAYVQTYQDLRRRIKDHPQPDNMDLQLGIYKEAIEPQVGPAVVQMRANGYLTVSSGFIGDRQVVDGRFAVPPSAYAALEQLGARVQIMDRETRGWVDGPPRLGAPAQYHKIEFWPETADLGAIQRQWDAVAKALPRWPAAWPSREDSDGVRSFKQMAAEGTLATEFLPWWIATCTGATVKDPSVPKLARAVKQDPELWAAAEEMREHAVAQARSAHQQQ